MESATNIHLLVFVMKMQCVYCEVKTDCYVSLR